MIDFKKALYIILGALSMFSAVGCKNGWEEHTALLENTSKATLLEQIASEPELSKFYAYIKQAELEEVLASSKTNTVWAPNNQAIDALLAESPNYLSSTEAVKSFVKYHIAGLFHPVKTSQDTLRIQTMDSLFVSVSGPHYEEASVVKGGIIAKNGLLHIVDKALMVKSSVFDAAKSFPNLTSQKLAMESLDTAGVDPAGNPIVKRSPKWASLVRRMASKDSLYTYFVLSNDAFDAEYNRITPYYKSTKTNRPDSTQIYLTRIGMLQDLLVKGLYTQDKLPDTLISVTGTKIPVKKSAIVSSYKANNGIVYVVNELPYRLKDKIREFKIEGEQLNRTNSRNDRNGNIFIRSKLDDKGVPFRDIQVWDHKVADFFVQYPRADVNTVVYNVYARAISGTVADNQTVDFTQRFGVPTATVFGNTTVLFTQTVRPQVYTEVLLGQFEMRQFGTLIWRAIGANNASTNSNTISFDYLRFVPVLPN
jgi:uncharacterized surface protein with fasciclin (FAS1) repeats